MQKSGNRQTVGTHRKVQASTTLNRRYVKQPNLSEDLSEADNSLEVKIQDFGQQEAERKMQNATQAALERAAGGLTTEAFDDPVAEVKRRVGLARPAKRTIKVEDQPEMQKHDLEAEVQAAVRPVKRRTIQVAETTEVETPANNAVQKTAASAPVVAKTHPLQAVANRRLRARKVAPQVSKKSAQQLKNEAIQKAVAATAQQINQEAAEHEKKQKRIKMHFGVGRVLLAFSCAAAAVAGIIYLVNTNMPDISMRVAALQTGIEASYPGYVPRGFSLSGMSSEDGKVVLKFKSEADSSAYTLVEENSSWDSNALLANYVKPEYKEDYSIVKEQGLTLYMNDKAAAWVNGGVVYKLTIDNGELTKKQIRSIAVSL